MSAGGDRNVGISRRDFVKGAAAGVAAVGVAGAGISLAPSAALAAGIPTTWDYQADLIVVGSGGAGLACAATAAEAGASVIVVEANDRIGGKTIQAGGNFGVGTSFEYKGRIAAAATIASERFKCTIFAFPMVQPPCKPVSIPGMWPPSYHPSGGGSDGGRRSLPSVVPIGRPVGPGAG